MQKFMGWLVLMGVILMSALLPWLPANAAEQAQSSAFNWFGFLCVAAPVAFNAVTNIMSFFAGQKNHAKTTASAATVVDKTSDALVVVSQAVGALVSIAAAAQAAQAVSTTSATSAQPVEP